MKPGSRYTVGWQPCQNLLRGDADIMALPEGNRRNVHQCPTCEGNRTWCDNCHTDHHDGGWETCKTGAYAEPEEREDDDTQATPRLLADGFVCDLCNDSGTVAKSVRMSGDYRGPGPVPEHAKGVYEAFCDCEFGQQLAREEVQHYRQQAAKIAAHNREAKETAGRKRVADMIEGEGHDL